MSADFQTSLAEFQRIFRELAAKAASRNHTGQPVHDEIRALAAAGFGRLRVPLEYGGFGVDLPTLFELLAEAGTADSNVPQILRGHFTTVEILRRSPSLRQRELWLRRAADGAIFGNAQSEPASDSPDFLPSTRLHHVDGQAVISGVKYYSTGALYADYIRVAAAVADSEDGDVTFAVVSANDPRVTHADDWDGIGQRLTGSGTTYFDAVPVSEDGDLGRSKSNLRSIQAFVQLVHLANLAGIARNIVSDAVALLKSRQRTHLHALSAKADEDPEVLGVVGNLYRHAQTADALLVQVATGLERANQLTDAGLDAEDDYARNFIDVSAAQVTIIESVLDASTQIFNAGGASAIRGVESLDRHWRNARTLASHNPVVYKPRVIGDFVVNGTTAKSFYDRKRGQQPSNT
ncbi:acyl-CoA dehydrogenase family protein [Mycobacterium sp. 236(2023)]|uniref:acyl-CoA dehydrogenase family protein n=1 Tax=Mycobacterium sp. 236(2023) TaxID=3038163 RepID=UPI00241511A5|nr:acyl-CoA dehydrogenase family protein [Mycobacterium sp. 236(2023)]MDG4667638.1 acyl-CoA dehydrogenase family protein [Mycobacterium sp. 236(2023)]